MLRRKIKYRMDGDPANLTNYSSPDNFRHDGYLLEISTKGNSNSTYFTPVAIVEDVESRRMRAIPTESVMFVDEVSHNTKVNVVEIQIFMVDRFRNVDPLIIQGEFMQWGFGEKNQTVGIVKIGHRVVNPYNKDAVLYQEGQIIEVEPKDIRFV